MKFTHDSESAEDHFLQITNSKFNHFEVNEACIHVDKYDYVYFNNITMSECKASSGPGAIHFYLNNKFEVHNSLFRSNEGEYGGAIK